MPKFDYAVKYNGKYYPAGADIPEATQKAAEAAESASDVKAKEEPAEEQKAAQKAVKSRKKGDA